VEFGSIHIVTVIFQAGWGEEGEFQGEGIKVSRDRGQGVAVGQADVEVQVPDYLLGESVKSLDPVSQGIHGFDSVQVELPPASAQALGAQLSKGDDEVGQKVPSPTDEGEAKAERGTGREERFDFGRRFDYERAGNLLQITQGGRVRRWRWVKNKGVRALERKQTALALPLGGGAADATKDMAETAPQGRTQIFRQAHLLLGQKGKAILAESKTHPSKPPRIQETLVK
jgi:hypothetical protein